MKIQLEKLEVKGGISKENLKNRLYARSPYNLCTDKEEEQDAFDDAYRNGVDEALDLIWEYLFSK